MTYKDYMCMKQGKKFSVGKFTDDIFVLEVFTGYGVVPEYRLITKSEYNTYDIWKNDKDKIKDILTRPILCSGYQGETEFDETKVHS